MAGKDIGPYLFLKALRPFSFAVAIVNGGLASTLAYHQAAFDPLRALLVFVGCLLLQAGVNLINDLADLRTCRGAPFSPDQRIAIYRNARWGTLCFMLAFVIASYLIMQVGWPLLAVCTLGLMGALGYTLEPINFKRRGLAVFLVFWLMGVLMVSGGYLAITGSWQVQIALLSVPVSLLTALLLLSNEIRDLDQDRSQQIGSLSVRIGMRSAQWLFVLIVISSYLCWWRFYALGWIKVIWPMGISLICLPIVLIILRDSRRHQDLPPKTGAFFMLFGMGYLVAVIDLLP